MATLVESEGRWRSGYLDDPRWGPALGRPPGLLEPVVLNSDRFRGTPFPAVALHATALSPVLGMGGAGGCAAWAEPAARYGAAYLTRGLGGHDRGDVIEAAITARFHP